MPRDKIRAVRLSDDLWEAVQRKAAEEGRAASEVVRELLERWVMRPPRKRA
ncbi:ribbon-helix-helix protein, CopG family [Mycobacterium gordonae]|uniref:ribbon-helix-helix protein, CopG family n=1 Tax=Mycobacterium gordonae TaxID=1778 RepID=UPI0012EA5D8C